MRVFIPVFFNAPMGGLQAHVRAQCKALMRSGNDPVVMCKPGPFSRQLMGDGVSVLLDDLSDVDGAADAVTAGCRFDLVHAHPFQSREIGRKVAQKLGIPFIVTFHGKYLDDLESWKHSADLILCVSPALRDYLVSQTIVPPSRFAVLPNGVDTSVYRPKPGHASGAPALADGTDGEGYVPRVAVASRFDGDKRFLVHLLVDTLRIAGERRAFDIRWDIAGAGALVNDIARQASELNNAAGEELVSLHGWLDEPDLADLYRSASLCIGPGRCALDAMACSKPVVALGSQGYVGLLESRSLLEGLYTNFGGHGSRGEIRAETMFDDIDGIIHDRERLARLGRQSAAFVRTFFAQKNLDAKLLSLYASLAGESGPQQAPLSSRSVSRNAWDYFAPNSQDVLSPRWHNHCTNDSLAVTKAGNGGLTAACRFADKEFSYLTVSRNNFSLPGDRPDLFPIMAGTEYSLEISYCALEGEPGAVVWLIEYSDSGRLQAHAENLKTGLNVLRFATSPEARSFRLMLRFSGRGRATVSRFSLYARDHAPSPPSPVGAASRYEISGTPADKTP